MSKRDSCHQVDFFACTVMQLINQLDLIQHAGNIDELDTLNAFVDALDKLHANTSITHEKLVKGVH